MDAEGCHEDLQGIWDRVRIKMVPCSLHTEPARSAGGSRAGAGTGLFSSFRDRVGKGDGKAKAHPFDGEQGGRAETDAGAYVQGVGVGEEDAAALGTDACS